jgi:hypothetical protein
MVGNFLNLEKDMSIQVQGPLGSQEIRPEYQLLISFHS